MFIVEISMLIHAAICSMLCDANICVLPLIIHWTQFGLMILFRPICPAR